MTVIWIIVKSMAGYTPEPRRWMVRVCGLMLAKVAAMERVAAHCCSLTFLPVALKNS